jgi:putative DNA primase/helicase
MRLRSADKLEGIRRCRLHNLPQYPIQEVPWTKAVGRGRGAQGQIGKPYTVGADILPTDFPDWLVSWIEKYTVGEFAAAGGKDIPKVDEDFDFDGFREWLPFEITQDGYWYIAEFCPGVNRRHEHSTKTGIFFDGSRLCWKCFAQNCPCAYKEDGRKFTIGDLVRKIAKEIGAYDGAIWPQASVDELLDDFHAEDANTVPKAAVIEPNGHDQSYKHKTGEYRFHTEKTPKFNATIVGIRMSDIRTEKLEWLWPDKIPAGNITLFGGQPGCGKSVVLLDIIARTTTGRDWADGSKNPAGPRDVLLLASEDGEADTIKPRLIAAGADMSRIIVIRRVLLEPPDGDKAKGKSKHAFQLSEDTLTLKNALKANPKVALVALDPISAFFGDCDPNKDKEIRPVMEAIADAMEGTKCAFIGIIHNNKRGDADSISKILGASSVVGVARAVWGFGYDSDDKTLRHMLLVKGNLSEKRTGMSYKLVNTPIKLDDGEEDRQPVCDWQGETDEDADDMLAKKREKAKNGGVELKSDAAQTMLLRELDSGWRLLRDLHRIRETEGISESTMKRARYTLGIICTKSAPWMWIHQFSYNLFRLQPSGHNTFIPLLIQRLVVIRLFHLHPNLFFPSVVSGSRWMRMPPPHQVPVCPACVPHESSLPPSRAPPRSISCSTHPMSASRHPLEFSFWSRALASSGHASSLRELCATRKTRGTS